MWQNTAYILIGIGILVLIGWSVKVFFMASDIPLIIRIATGAIGAGVLEVVVLRYSRIYPKGSRHLRQTVLQVVAGQAGDGGVFPTSHDLACRIHLKVVRHKPALLVNVAVNVEDDVEVWQGHGPDDVAFGFFLHGPEGALCSGGVQLLPHVGIGRYSGFLFQEACLGGLSERGPYQGEAARILQGGAST